MRIHCIGHASLLIETVDQKILMDPVFWDPHYEGLCAVSPQRVDYPEKIPSYSLIVVSHRHLDHFDIRTLATLDRSCPVIIPDCDAVLAYALRELGFRRVEALPDKHQLALGQTMLVTTPSKALDREFGLLIQDPTATVWNQVDTSINSQLARAVPARFGPIDLFIATWQPLLESEVLTNKVTGFPYEGYFHLLSNIKLSSPRAVMPGSCGFKYLGEAAWLNKFVFPLTREAFQRDVKKLLPESQCIIVNPGDVLEIGVSGIALGAGQSPFVCMTQDDCSETAFNPTGSVPDLHDANPSGYDTTEMLQVIEEFLHRRLVPALHDSLQQRGLMYEYGSIGCIYQLDVVFPAEVLSWSIDFGEHPIRLVKRTFASPNIHAQITASALSDLLLARRGPHYVYNGGFYRWFSQLYLVEQHGFYPWKPMSEKSLADPLWMAIDVNDAFVKYIGREISLHNQHQFGG